MPEHFGDPQAITLLTNWMYIWGFPLESGHITHVDTDVFTSQEAPPSFGVQSFYLGFIT